MKIVNKTKKTTLSDQAFEARSFFDKSLGLLNPHKPRSLIMQTRFGVHTFGMKTKIDILILDKKQRVTSLRMGLMPYRIFLWNPKYDQVIELPNGTLHSSRTELGDTIEFSHNT